MVLIRNQRKATKKSSSGRWRKQLVHNLVYKSKDDFEKLFYDH